MSIMLMSAVWRMDLPPTEKMVLLALADAANDDGVTWMAIKSKTAGKMDFMKKTSLSERAIQNCLKRLAESGMIERTFREGKGVLYTVTLGGVQEVHPAARAPGGAGGAPKPSTTTSPNGEREKRASKRCPETWRPSGADQDVGVQEGMTNAQIIRATAEFRDHTFATARTDWSATYRNWLRRAAERKPRNDRSDSPHSSPKLDKLERIAGAMAASVEREEGEYSGDRHDPANEDGGGVCLEQLGGSR